MFQNGQVVVVRVALRGGQVSQARAVVSSQDYEGAPVHVVLSERLAGYCGTGPGALMTFDASDVVAC